MRGAWNHTEEGDILTPPDSRADTGALFCSDARTFRGDF